jgi:hypothetical protein
VSHLGRWLSALVDGELDGTERDRVLNHIAGCQSCRQEANAMRALKRRLTALGESSAEPAIAGRLIELAHTDQGGRPPGDLLAPSPERIAHTGRGADWAPRLVAQSWRMAAGSAGGALLAIGVVAFLLGSGGSQPPVPQVTPSVDSYLIEHAYDAGQAPAGTAPSVGSQSAQGRRAGPAGPALARPGLPVRHRPGSRAFQLASPQPTGHTALSPVSSPAASPAASATAQVSPSPGRHVTSQHPR